MLVLPVHALFGLLCDIWWLCFSSILVYSPKDLIAVDLGDLIVAPASPPSRVAHVLTNRQARPEHLPLLFKLPGQILKLKVRAGTDNPRDDLFIFEFEKSDDLEVVLRMGLWSFDNRIMVFEVLKPRDQVSKLKLAFVDFWIHVSTFYLAGLRLRWQGFGSVVGGGEECFLWGIRYSCVLWDVSKPLRRDVTTMRNGNPVFLFIKYENLPDFCYKCGMLSMWRKSA